MWRAPSLQTLWASPFACISDNAELIRAIWKAETRDALQAVAGSHLAPIGAACRNPLAELKLKALDSVTECYGVEYLGKSRKTGEAVLYCNAGDTYAETLIATGQTLALSCWGDMVESGSVKPGRFPWLPGGL